MKISSTLVMFLALALAACAGVLGLKQTSESHPFEHRAHVDKGVSCVTCHAGISSSDDLSERCICRRRPSVANATKNRMISAIARFATAEASTRQSAEMARQHLRFDHRQHMPAVHGDCVQCHSGVAEAQPVSLRPTMATCFGCHEHQDQWRTRDCDSCHVNLPGEHVLPSSHVVHDGDWIREHGVRAASSPDLCEPAILNARARPVMA